MPLHFRSGLVPPPPLSNSFKFVPAPLDPIQSVDGSDPCPTVCVRAAMDYTGFYADPLYASARTLGCGDTPVHEHLLVYWVGALGGTVVGVAVQPSLDQDDRLQPTSTAVCGPKFDNSQRNAIQHPESRKPATHTNADPGPDPKKNWGPTNRDRIEVI